MRCDEIEVSIFLESLIMNGKHRHALFYYFRLRLFEHKSFEKNLIRSKLSFVLFITVLE